MLRKQCSEIKYCTECGLELEDFFTGRFDSATGEKLKRKDCLNEKCERGCRRIGHQYNFWGFGSTCRRCGYVMESHSSPPLPPTRKSWEIRSDTPTFMS